MIVFNLSTLACPLGVPLRLQWARSLLQGCYLNRQWSEEIWPCPTISVGAIGDFLARYIDLTKCQAPNKDGTYLDTYLVRTRSCDKHTRMIGTVINMGVWFPMYVCRAGTIGRPA